MSYQPYNYNTQLYQGVPVYPPPQPYPDYYNVPPVQPCYNLPPQPYYNQDGIYTVPNYNIPI